MSYFDFNATTPLLPQVKTLLSERLSQLSGPSNPSSIHRFGRDARKRLEEARQTLARILGCEPSEICFTASGSEADALALLGSWRARTGDARKKVVISSIEHPAILFAAKQLEKEGAEVVRLDPNSQGRVPLEAFESQLTDDVFLCSLMWANNETGVLQPVQEVSRLCRQRRILFHTDAVQAVGKVEVTLREVDADLLAMTAHKFGGPTGIGALVVRKGVELVSLVPGHQEKGRRGGTSNVLYAEAMALALEWSHSHLNSAQPRMQRLRDEFEKEVCARIPEVVIHGVHSPRVPNTSNLRFEGADAEVLLISLDLEGFCVSTGAACASGSLTPSHVLTAMGLTGKQTHGSIRVSMGPTTTPDDVSRFLDALVKHVPRAREAAQQDG